MGIYLASFLGVGSYPVVFLSDWKLVREAFRDERFAGTPPIPIFEQRSFGKQRGIIYSTGKPWLEQRRFVVKNLKDFGFGKRSMEELIKDEVVELISEFKKKLNHPVSLNARFNMAVINSLWHIISGERYSHDNPRLSKILKIFSQEFDKVQASGPLFLVPWLSRIFPKLSGLQALLDVQDSIYEFLQESVDAHKRTFDMNNPRDLIDVYLQEIEMTTDPSSSFMKEEGEKELLTVLCDLFLAGIDTTSASLNWTLLYLIINPKVQDKIHKEIDSVVGSSTLPSLSDRPRMPYMEAVIAESMRLSSIAAVGGMHSTTETMEFHGYTLPKDTIVFANLWQLHHDKDYWGDPENFRPERFINSEGTFKKDDGLNPFSIGKRACPGESLARDETFLFLGGLLQQFCFEMDLNSPPPSTEPTEIFISRPKSFTVIIRDRLRMDSKF